jgi:cytochrome c-type biogenesis protein CcmH/NrfG
MSVSKALSNSQQRISALLRVIALVCILLGVVFAVDIYQTVLIPQLVPIFYLMAALMIFTGLVVLIAKFDD